LPQVTLDAPWLILDLGGLHRTAGWPIVGAAFGQASAIAWLQVRDAELSEHVEPRGYFLQRAQTDGIGAEIGLAPNWSAKIEYLYVDLADSNFTTITGVSNGSQFGLVRAGVNYHF